MTPKFNSQGFDFAGGRAGTRTQNPLIKSQLLCQLSYAPAGCRNHGDSIGVVKLDAARLS